LFKDEKQVLENFNDTLSTITFKDNHGHIGDTYRTKNVIIIENIGKYKKYDKKVDELLGIDPLSVICVPIIVDNEFIGVLELVNSKEKRSFDEMDLEFINTIANIASATMENAKLFKWAISDGLTQIYNIHFFRRMLEQEIKKIDRYGGVLSIIMMDVDDFKTVNDTYGHQIGDKVLQMLSSIIKKNIREEIDLPGRYGGDEFIVLLPNTNLKGAEILANRLLEKIRSSKIKANGSTINFTSSLGCAEFKKGKAMEDLIEAADKAMYLSKNKGKNSVCSVENY
jgi:diguanylate cyclase (GGDEF)-like protein